MKRTTILITVVAALCAGSSKSDAQRASDTLEARRSAAGAIATDEHWSQAEIHGDTAFIGALLLPGYRSVGPDGVAHSRAMIIAGAGKRGADTVASMAAAAAYRAAHPSRTQVVLEGNTAVLTFYAPALGPEKGVRSSDILVYDDGRWHAIYSQHSNVQ